MREFSAPVAAEQVVAQLRRSDAIDLTLTHAWVVMPDHVHWLFALNTTNLSTCVARFKSKSARAVNGALGRDGALWQAGFYDHRLRNEEDVRRQARYIACNPIRAGLVETLGSYPYWWCRWISHEAEV